MRGKGGGVQHDGARVLSTDKDPDAVVKEYIDNFKSGSLKVADGWEVIENPFKRSDLVHYGIFVARRLPPSDKPPTEDFLRRRLRFFACLCSPRCRSLITKVGFSSYSSLT